MLTTYLLFFMDYYLFVLMFILQIIMFIKHWTYYLYLFDLISTKTKVINGKLLSETWDELYGATHARSSRPLGGYDDNPTYIYKVEIHGKQKPFKIFIASKVPNSENIVLGKHIHCVVLKWSGAVIELLDETEFKDLNKQIFTRPKSSQNKS